MHSARFSVLSLFSIVVIDVVIAGVIIVVIVAIANASAGVHEYFPVHFDERHLTLCDVTVHAHLLEHDPVQSEDSVTFDTHRRYDARAIRTIGIVTGLACATAAAQPRRQKAGGSDPPCG